jgi:hypothetical protein
LPVTDLLASMTDPPVPPPDAHQAFVAALVDIGGGLSQIVDHMVRFSATETRGPAPGHVFTAEPVFHTLRALLCDVLRPDIEAAGTDQVEMATALLLAAEKRIGDEIFMVPPASPNRAARRRARHGGRTRGGR